MELSNGYAAIITRLVIARKRAGLSQGQASELVGKKSHTTISAAENFERGLTLSEFLKLCEIYGCSPTWALCGINPDFDATELIKAAGDASQDMIRIIDLMSSLDIDNRNECAICGAPAKYIIRNERRCSEHKRG